jgi:phosphoribosylamine--glycine ligase
MNVVIIGGGGREHALAWKLRQSSLCDELYCIPGNAGIAEIALCEIVPVKPDFSELIAWCRDHAIDLVVVGPERLLSEGVVDILQSAGLTCFGPNRDASRIESCKKFAKKLMQQAGIPTGESRVFSRYDDALSYLENIEPPFVIKATGLAEGKGVAVTGNIDEAQQALHRCLVDCVFGEAGREVLIEEYLEGEEASLLAFSDGTRIQLMDSAQDHKPIYDGDRGPNTGGMGSYSPAPVVTPEIRERCRTEILEPCIQAFRDRGIDFRGVLYAGLMITAAGPKVIEFNCRFGDPETQALLPRLQTDLVEVMLACANGKLSDIDLQWSNRSAVCVVAASGGYPGLYEKNRPISGLDELKDEEDVIVFHAGTRLEGDRVVTNGGRVLGVTAMHDSLEKAIKRSYACLDRIDFDGKHARRDIGHHALKCAGTYT